MSYSPTLGRWLEQDPIGYTDGMNLYQSEGSDPVVGLDPLGFETWYQKQGCETDCEGVVDAVSSSLPALPNGRLKTALDKSGFDWLILVADAYLESSFNPDAKNPRSSATGLFQILDTTADDIQDRIWKKWVSSKNPIVSGGERLRDYRTDPFIATTAAYVYMLDRIAFEHFNLLKGLDRYGTGPGTGYGRRVLAGVAAIRKVCGFKPGEPVSRDAMLECARKHCKELKAALSKAVR
jgi:hypothetical protein